MGSAFGLAAGFGGLYDLLQQNGFDLSTRGKGRNVFMPAIR
mgnify:CR=1 FL=1